MMPLALARNSKTSASPSRLQISAVGTAVFLIWVALGLAPTIRYNNPMPVIAGVVVGLYFLFAIRVAEHGKRRPCCDWADKSGCEALDSSPSFR